MRMLILLSIVAVLVVSGCTATNILCEADYVKSAEISMVGSISLDDSKDMCKQACYTAYETTSYKMVKTTKTLFGEQTYNAYICYCDVNECGEKLVVE